MCLVKALPFVKTVGVFTSYGRGHLKLKDISCCCDFLELIG